ncbi:AAA family ATPase [Microbacterium album]|uniref:Nuclease SbcCD subunit C n=1 Tax=Microbacterium album TaxID=2053191 RepID=A0A917IJM5_9MICO|nr:SMC family ATPase [Microbacterium album]GGH49948.1 hypothetical protein GCM10010921_28350 [Microbacterium album]
MRIQRIEIEGFGPFRARQEIDLDAYAGDGIFLISGRTGAGKSSILDAVCFALYGSAPRYEEGEKRLRSDHAEPDDRTEVALEFTTGGRTWRIERSPDYLRPKKRGDGMTPQAATARMFERVDGAWEGRAARPVDVAHLVDEVIGLSQQQFLQVILLAQGRFARFLLARNDERQALLRTLFGTQRFEDYTAALEQRRKDAVAHVERGSQALIARIEQAEHTAAGILDAGIDAGIATGETEGGDGARAEAAAAGSEPGLAERIARLERAALRARHVAEEADAAEQETAKAHAAAEAEHGARTARRDKQRRRDTARATLAGLDAEATAIDALRAELDAAQRAEPVRAARDGALRALAALEAANDALDAARAAWEMRGEVEDDAPSPADPEALDAYVSAAQQRIGAWQPVRDVEAGLDDAAAALADLRERAADAAARAARIEERAAALPAERERIEEALDRATATAATAESHRQALALREAQLDAARAVADLAAAYAAAVAAAQEAKARKDAAEARLDELHRRRIADIAGELAEQLADGEPCAVCGATEHPSPAPRRHDPVTSDAIDAAERDRADAVQAEDAAAGARRAAELALREAEGRAGGRAAADLEAEIAAARAGLTAAEDAAAERERLAAERTRLETERQQQDDRRAALIAERSDLDARIAAGAEALERDRSAVAAARGAFASVAARIDVEHRLVALATAYAEAQRAAVRAEATAVDARDRLQEAVEAAGFDSADAALAALRDAAERAALDARIREHDAALAATKATLMDLELEILPEEPIDTVESELALAAAKAAWGDAVKAHTEAAQRARALEDGVERIRSEHEKIAALEEEAAAIRRLADTVAGRAPNAKRMKLETFVLAAELEEIVAAANLRLAEMSGDRYLLQHTDALAARGAASGLGLEVMDRFTGRARPPHSLSGGETFLASLALALGLAEVVTSRAGGIRLDTLFIDEGFGSLDAETLDTAMRTLDELRQGGRTVGVISHVEAMKEQIPAQLRVEQTPQGWSVVTQDAALTV